MARFQPLKENIQRELPGWLSEEAGPADQGRCSSAATGSATARASCTWPAWTATRNPAAGGVPVAWLREQLAACPAKVKLLIIDACHAGSEKGGPAPCAGHVEGFRRRVRAVRRGLVTLASSDSGQKSLIWDAVQQSLFTRKGRPVAALVDVAGDDLETLSLRTERRVSDLPAALSRPSAAGRRPVARTGAGWIWSGPACHGKASGRKKTAENGR